MEPGKFSEHPLRRAPDLAASRRTRCAVPGSFRSSPALPSCRPTALRRGLRVVVEKRRDAREALVDGREPRPATCQQVLDAAGSAVQSGAGLCRELHNEGLVVRQRHTLPRVRSPAEPVVPGLRPVHHRRHRAQQPAGSPDRTRKFLRTRSRPSTRPVAGYSMLPPGTRHGR